MRRCTCKLVFGSIDFGPRRDGAPTGRARDPLCPVHGPIRCDHCGETDSREGFLEVDTAATLEGVKLEAGDRLRVECARRLGFEPTEPTHQPLVFRAW
jgi:hypothetical protein